MNRPQPRPASPREGFQVVELPQLVISRIEALARDHARARGGSGARYLTRAEVITLGIEAISERRPWRSEERAE